MSLGQLFFNISLSNTETSISFVNFLLYNYNFNPICFFNIGRPRLGPVQAGAKTCVLRRSTHGLQLSLSLSHLLNEKNELENYNHCYVFWFMFMYRQLMKGSHKEQRVSVKVVICI